MSRLSVVIPVYQHAAACGRCLASLAKQTRLPDEVVVVDDGSTDGLKEAIARFLKDYPVPLRLIRFEENRGAPAARNEGARQTNEEYIIFLDADIELQPTMLERYEATLEAYPEIDIVYSAHDFGWKRFPLVKFDAEQLKQHNFIHMSSLLRRSAFPGFDESLKKFQDWDLWLTMMERGSRALGIEECLFRLEPRSSGYSQWLPSFVYTLPWEKLGWSPRLVKKYRQAEQRIREKHHLPPANSYTHDTGGARLWLTLPPLLAIACIELLSFWVVFHPTLNSVVCILLGLAMLLLAVFRPTQALTLLATEYVIGSKGALFNIRGDVNNNGGISLRIVLFSAFFLGWVIYALRTRKEKAWRAFFKGRVEYLVLALVLVGGFVQGVLQHNQFVLADANAWGFWLLLLPVLNLARRAKTQDLYTLKNWMIAAFTWIVLKTLLLFYLFSHAYPAWILEPMYLWIRRTGVGEITRAGGNVFRIFFQSHIYAVLLLPGLILIERWKRDRRSLILCGFAAFFLAQTLVSLSRSFFLGLAVAGLSACIPAWRITRLKGVVWLAGRFIATSIVAGVIVAAVCFFPIPYSSSSLLNAWQSRISAADDASASRWKLLPAMWEKIKERPILGHGFGATVTYTSRDPRVVQSTGGVYTTYAFEWGWLEHWIKFGILGIPLLLLILARLAQRIARSNLQQEQKHLLLLSLVALAAVHVSTPYLNHPLGFAWLIALEGIAERFQRS